MELVLEHGISFGMLVILELILGVDNLVVLQILCGKLAADQQRKARLIGLSLAFLLRVGMLCAMKGLMSLTAALFTVHVASFHHGFSARDLVVMLGGLFLIYKATVELTHRSHCDSNRPQAPANFWLAIFQIVVTDMVFSLDSVLTAAGMTENLWVMIFAVMASISIMLVISEPIGRFIERHVEAKVLALSFLMMIGTILLADGCGTHIPKSYLYACMGFSGFVQLCTVVHRSRNPVDHSPKEPGTPC